MNKDGVGFLCKIWSNIGPFNMNIFSDRLLLQKKVFLLQESGLNMGYTFGKYIRGPYCSSLAADGYKMNIVEENGAEKCNEDKLRILSAIGEGHEMDPSWFELVATIVYYLKKEGKSKLEAIETLKEEKPHLFSKELFEEAYERIRKLGFIPN